MPAEAKGISEKSAKAFVRHYVEALNYAAVAGDTEEARELSGAACKSCDAMLTKIETIYSDGGYFKGDGWSVMTLKYQPFQPKEQPVVSVGLRIAKQEMLERPGADVQVFEPGRNQLTIRLAYGDPGWRIAQLDRLS